MDKVFLVHGLWMSGYACLYWRHAVRQAGMQPTIYSYHTVLEHLDNNADRLFHAVQRDGLDAPRLHFVGHSMGGVIARLMVSSTEGDALWNQLLAGREFDDGRMQRLRERVGPLMHFEPIPQVERAHVDEVKAFVDAILNNKPSPVPGENGLILNAIFDALYKSSETGHEVAVDVSLD